MTSIDNQYSLKCKLHFLMGIVIFMIFGCAHKEPAKKRMANRVVIIGLDGFSVDGYKTAKTPSLDSLFHDGTLSLTTRNVMPSVTLPNWTSHLTGSGPEQHGVLDNGWTREKILLPAVETDAEGYYPSIFKILKDAVPRMKTAFYYNWAELINSMNPKYFDEHSFEDNDEYLKNYSKAYHFIKKNKEAPTLVFLYSVHTDHAGHNYGWMSPEYIASIEEVDIEIGNFIDSLKNDGLYKDTHFMFFTDHGGLPNGSQVTPFGLPRSGHGGSSLQELQTPWAISGPGIKKGQIMTEPNNTVNTAVTIAHMFGCDSIPLSWTGELPMSIFETHKD